MTGVVVDPLRDVVWQDDGNGKRIVQWNLQLGAPPSEASNARLVNYPLTPKTAQHAITEGALYVNSFFSQEQQLLMLAMASTGTSEQKAKLAEIYSWIRALYIDASASPETFNPVQQPPYLWEDLL